MREHSNRGTLPALQGWWGDPRSMLTSIATAHSHWMHITIVHSQIFASSLSFPACPTLILFDLKLWMLPMGEVLRTAGNTVDLLANRKSRDIAVAWVNIKPLQDLILTFVGNWNLKPEVKCKCTFHLPPPLHAWDRWQFLRICRTWSIFFLGSCTISSFGKSPKSEYLLPLPLLLLLCYNITTKCEHRWYNMMDKSLGRHVSID